MFRLLIVLILVAALTACGGASGTSSSSSSNPSPGTSSPPGQALAVTVAGGQTTTGVDVFVAPPTASAAPNAQYIGVADPSAGSLTLANVGASVTRGSTQLVMLLGDGLSGNMQVQVSGPQDITVSNIKDVPVQGSNPPGIQFTLSVSPSAALGARTVLLIAGNDMTAFAGGLEVIP